MLRGGIIVIPQSERITLKRGHHIRREMFAAREVLSRSLASCWHDDFLQYDYTVYTFYIDFCYGSEQAAATWPPRTASV
jgi:hypothetical protein